MGVNRLHCYDSKTTLSTTWWTNFRKSISWPGQTVAEYRDVRDKELEKWGAKKVERPFESNSYVEFDDKQKLLLFLLRWA